MATQSFPAYEHIVIDGASRDDTLKRLRRYTQLQIISEPDRGLYDAINKGISRASGDVICLLNSDDRLLPGALEAASAAFDRHPAAASVCGRIRVGELEFDANDVELGTRAMQRLRAGDLISGYSLTNGRFFRRVVFDRIGLFDQQFPVLADRDFLSRYFLADFDTLPIEDAVYRYGTHSNSLSFGSALGRIEYNQEAIRLASVRLGQAKSERHRKFYRRWLGWAVGYALYRGLKEGSLSKVYEMSMQARSQLPLWPAEFVAQAAWHVATLGERRGGKI